jgi:hypothetical protein
LEAIKALPKRWQSQAPKYAPEVAIWFVAWHDYMDEHQKEAPAPEPQPSPGINPFDPSGEGMDPRFRALIEALVVLGEEAGDVDVVLNSRDGLTELTLLFPGELA